jgi:hypothetical protein
MSGADGTFWAMTAGTRKMADPIIVPMTTFVASSNVNRRGKVSTAGAAACGVIRASISADEARWNFRAGIVAPAFGTAYWILLEPP